MPQSKRLGLEIPAELHQSLAELARVRCDTIASVTRSLLRAGLAAEEKRR